MHRRTIRHRYAVSLEGPEGCQEALRKSVCSETDRYHLPTVDMPA